MTSVVMILVYAVCRAADGSVCDSRGVLKIGCIVTEADSLHQNGLKCQKHGMGSLLRNRGALDAIMAALLG